VRLQDNGGKITWAPDFQGTICHLDCMVYDLGFYIPESLNEPHIFQEGFLKSIIYIRSETDRDFCTIHEEG